MALVVLGGLNGRPASALVVDVIVVIPACVVVPGYHHPDVAVELLGTFGPSAFRDLIAVYAPGIEAPLPEHIPGYLGAVGAIQLIEVVDSAVVVLVPGSSVLIL